MKLNISMLLAVFLIATARLEAMGTLLIIYMLGYSAGIKDKKKHEPQKQIWKL